MTRTLYVQQPDGRTVQVHQAVVSLLFPCPACGHVIQPVPEAWCVRCGAKVLEVRDGVEALR